MPDLQPASLADVPDVVALFARYDAVEFGTTQMDPPDVSAPLTAEGTEAVAVREDGVLVGYAHLAANGEAESLAEPGSEGLHDALLDWIVRRAAERGIARLEHWSGPRPDGLAVGPLTRHGFTHVRTAWHMARDAGPAPAAVWPEGVRLRPFDRDRDAREVHAVVERAFAGAFGSHSRPFEEWAHLALADGTEVLCVEEDGRLVAVATRPVRLGNGHVGQLAVDPASRGRGLALALLHEAFRLDTEQGRRTTLNVDGENEQARRLYERAGMHVEEEYRRWERDVQAV